MKKRPTASLVCGCTLIVALIMPAFAGETTQTPEIFQPYYKILNLNTFHWDPLCLQDCTSEAFDVSVWGRVVGQSTVWGGPPTYQSHAGIPHRTQRSYWALEWVGPFPWG